MRNLIILHESQKRSALVFACCLAAVMLWRMWQAQEVRELPLAPPIPALPEICINTADSSEWASLQGIGPVLSQRIIKYRQMIQGFDSIGQIQQVYGLKAETYQKILPQVRLDSYPHPKKSTSFPKSKYKQSYSSPQKKKTPIAPINLNTADSSSLVQISGIGPVLSQRILKYRKLIGYYHQVEQLQEVYGLSEENYQRMKAYLFTDAQDFHPPKSLNQATAFELYVHGSISKKLAFSILRKRKRYGRFQNWEELQQVEGMTKEAMSCLQRYFSVEG